MALIGSQNSGQYSPSDTARRRAFAEALTRNNSQPSVDPLSAIAKTLAGSVAGYENTQADNLDAEGRSVFSQGLVNSLRSPDLTLDELGNLASNPYANPQQSQLIAALMGQKMDAMDPMKQTQLAQAQLNLEQDQTGQGDLGNGYGTIYSGTDADGNIVPMRLGPGGNFDAVPTPEGVTFDPAAMTRERALGTKIGGGIGDAQLGAASAVSNADVALDLLDQIAQHPGLQYGTGAQAQLGLNNVFPDRIAFQKLVDQAKGGAFLSAIQQLRGLGALSNAEGAAATSATTRMDTALEDADFIAALNDYRRIIQRGRQAAMEIINRTRSPLDAPPPLPDGTQPSQQQGGQQTQKPEGENWEQTPIPNVFIRPVGN